MARCTVSDVAVSVGRVSTLGFALLPGLSQFGLSLALGIVYAFLASVFVLPSLLALWARYGAVPVARSTPGQPEAAGDD